MSHVVATRRIYLVRHGITHWNRAMRFQGHTDIELDAEGREQAARIGTRLALTTPAPTAIWSSDLVRARFTAEAIASPLGLPVQTTPLLRETRMGAWEGLTREEIAARGESELLELYRRDPYTHRPPDGESVDSASERMTQAMQTIRETHPTGAVVIVGHGGSLRALLVATLGAPIPTVRHFSLDNASLSIIEEFGPPDNVFARLALVNDTSHLTGLVLPENG